MPPPNSPRISDSTIQNPEEASDNGNGKQPATVDEYQYPYGRVHVVLMTFDPTVFAEINELDSMFRDNYLFDVTRLVLSQTDPIAEEAMYAELYRVGTQSLPDDLLILYYMGHGHMSDGMRFIMSANP